MNNENNGVVIEKKNNIGLLVLVILLLTSISFVGGLFLGLNKNKDKAPVNDYPQDKELGEVFISTVMENFEGIKISNERLYENDKFNISSINVNEMLLTALTKMDIYNVCSQDGKKKTYLGQLNDKLNDYVTVKRLEFNDIKNIESAGMSDPYDFDYVIKVNDEYDIEVKSVVCGAEFEPNDYVYKKITKGVQTGDTVYIYEKVAFAKYSTIPTDPSVEPIYKVDYYKDYKKTGEKVETLESMETSQDTTKTTPNWDLYNTYKYTFKLNDGRFYFESYELVK